MDCHRREKKKLYKKEKFGFQNTPTGSIVDNIALDILQIFFSRNTFGKECSKNYGENKVLDILYGKHVKEILDSMCIRGNILQGNAWEIFSGNIFWKGFSIYFYLFFFFRIIDSFVVRREATGGREIVKLGLRNTKVPVPLRYRYHTSTRTTEVPVPQSYPHHNGFRTTEREYQNHCNM